MVSPKKPKGISYQHKKRSLRNMPSSFWDLVLEKKTAFKRFKLHPCDRSSRVSSTAHFVLYALICDCLMLGTSKAHISQIVTLYLWLEQLKKPATKTHLNTWGSNKKRCLSKDFCLLSRSSTLNCWVFSWMTPSHCMKNRCFTISIH